MKEFTTCFLLNGYDTDLVLMAVGKDGKLNGIVSEVPDGVEPITSVCWSVRKAVGIRLLEEDMHPSGIGIEGINRMHYFSAYIPPATVEQPANGELMVWVPLNTVYKHKQWLAKEDLSDWVHEAVIAM